MKLAQPLVLPCGVTVRNRLLKSAMSEGLGTPSHGPPEGMARVYRRWAEGGLGVCVTGNVMIDGRALGEPGNVVVEDEQHLEALRAWAQAGTADGCQLWMQLNHPGKQAPRFLNAETVSASAVGFGKELSGAFPVPRALTVAEIEALIGRFARTAKVAVEAGFSGVQIHGAHGYLVSQFLSPRHNVREDEWGGSLENRARFVLAVYVAIREAVGPNVPVSIKMNSADFQRGGFDEDDSLKVMTWLQDAGIDLIEVSGGTYEAPAMTGMRASTREREGYFMAFVARARETLKVPLCVTGGFRTAAGMEQAVADGASMVGLARSLCVQPELPNQVLAGEDVSSLVRKLTTGFAAVDKIAALDITWYEAQIARMADGKDPLPAMNEWRSLASTLSRAEVQAFRMRRA